MSHKDWLDNEYKLWVEALQSSTVHNFKEHPMVKRMLGEAPFDTFAPLTYPLTEEQIMTLVTIDLIGKVNPPNTSLSGTACRMIYYAKKVLAEKPASIVEIGGGVGQFCATMYALGYTGNYYIYDLEPVQDFQQEYLKRVETVCGLDILNRFTYPFKMSSSPNQFCVSFYALGEFDDATKKHYFDNVVNRCQHGFVIWNPHSGASKDIPFPRGKCLITPEHPLTHPSNLQLTW